MTTMMQTTIGLLSLATLVLLLLVATPIISFSADQFASHEAQDLVLSLTSTKQPNDRTAQVGAGGSGEERSNETALSSEPLERFARRSKATSLPKFVGPIANVTAILGRDVRLICTVENLGQYQVAWLKEETKTILSIDTNIIITNYRIFLIPDEEERKWVLHIKDVQESDRGFYQCQVNTSPMRSTSGYLEVVVPPTIIESQTSQVAEVQEHSNISIQCKASGHPRPTIVWRREDGLPIRLNGRFSGGGETGSANTTTTATFAANANSQHQSIDTSGPQTIMSRQLQYKQLTECLLRKLPESELNEVKSDKLSFHDVDKSMAGVYACTASNGIQAQVSKRIPLFVEFAPKTSVQNKYISVSSGDQLDIECLVEGSPKATSYWSKVPPPPSETLTHEPHLPLPLHNRWAQLTSTADPLIDSGGWRRAFGLNGRKLHPELRISDVSPAAAVENFMSQAEPTELVSEELAASTKRIGPNQSNQLQDKTIPLYSNNYHPHNRIQLRQTKGDYRSISESLALPSHLDSASTDVLTGDSEIVDRHLTDQQSDKQTQTSRDRRANDQAVASNGDTVTKSAYLIVKQTHIDNYSYKLRMTIEKMQSEDFGKYSCIAKNPFGTSESQVVVTRATRTSEIFNRTIQSNTSGGRSVNENDYQPDGLSANYQSSPGAGARISSAATGLNRVTFDANYLQSIKSRQNSNFAGLGKLQQQKLKSRQFPERNSSSSRLFDRSSYILMAFAVIITTNMVKRILLFSWIPPVCHKTLSQIRTVPN